MSFHNLPDELINMICENLGNIRDLVSLSTCSKRLNYICRNENINIVYDIDNEKIINNALEFNKNIKLKLELYYRDSIIDFYSISKLHTLDLSKYRIKDVSMLGTIHTLDLSHRSDVTDVSMLGNVHTLNLTCCTNISDVSMLGNVHNLDLSWCFDIIDVSNLVNNHTLILAGCTSIKYFPESCNSHTLDLSYCKIKDFTRYINIKKLIVLFKIN
jgi:hypothetical protein